eukprot:1962237-Rhodomonas_salina.1
MRGLPYTVKFEEIRAFFKNCTIVPDGIVLCQVHASPHLRRQRRLAWQQRALRVGFESGVLARALGRVRKD